VGRLQTELEPNEGSDTPSLDKERELVAQLVAEGCDPLDIAAAAIRLARSQEQQRPIQEIREPYKSKSRKRPANSSRFGEERRPSRRKPRRAEPDMVRLYMDMGRAQQVRPSEIVGAIAGTTRIPGEDIGAIDIHQDGAFVDVRERHVGHVLDAMKGWTLRGQAINLQRAS